MVKNIIIKCINDLDNVAWLLNLELAQHNDYHLNHLFNEEKKDGNESLQKKISMGFEPEGTRTSTIRESHY